NGITLDGTTSIIIGGDNLGNEQNVISGNSNNGILMHNNTSSCAVYGNIIGLDPLGTSVFGNLINGIRIEDAHDVLIGGSQVEYRNVISGQNNTNAKGIFLANNGSGNVILNNFIGTDITGGI